MAIASIDVTLGALKSKDEVLTVLEIPRQIFTSCGYLNRLPKCDNVVADILLSDGRQPEAVQLYEKCVRSFRGEIQDFFACMLKLGDIVLWEDVREHLRRQLGTLSSRGYIPARRRRSNIRCAEAALEEFTRMNIYRGKAECFVRLGELALKSGQNTIAKEHFSEGRRMFLESGMTTEAEQIDSPEAEYIFRVVVCCQLSVHKFKVELATHVSDRTTGNARPLHRIRKPGAKKDETGGE
ncbi:hypothetical protein DFH07DRAFT_781522 [Mycena maculata]|uniref:Uncharacterized protein n=1 Tax=Mycena maculata TaxID=230809 RepID=A0AAD7MT14_9AGAR|nr:hypothetical protein DFH07DRAFT_781522 [Mycena maculata]